mmetsp:Transcript_33314/g.75948  ORF Transcript_33314/g.75948 Transcript_33314/m.75948 type:complete len:601 (-) Transcript_33314:54-1856(-)
MPAEPQSPRRFIHPAQVLHRGWSTLESVPTLTMEGPGHTSSASSSQPLRSFVESNEVLTEAADAFGRLWLPGWGHLKQLAWVAQDVAQLQQLLVRKRRVCADSSDADRCAQHLVAMLLQGQPSSGALTQHGRRFRRKCCGGIDGHEEAAWLDFCRGLASHAAQLEILLALLSEVMAGCLAEPVQEAKAAEKGSMSRIGWLEAIVAAICARKSCHLPPLAPAVADQRRLKAEAEDMASKPRSVVSSRAVAVQTAEVHTVADECKVSTQTQGTTTEHHAQSNAGVQTSAAASSSIATQAAPNTTEVSAQACAVAVVQATQTVATCLAGSQTSATQTHLLTSCEGTQTDRHTVATVALQAEPPRDEVGIQACAAATHSSTQTSTPGMQEQSTQTDPPPKPGPLRERQQNMETAHAALVAAREKLSLETAAVVMLEGRLGQANESIAALSRQVEALRHELLAERSRTQDALEAAAQAARRPESAEQSTQVEAAQQVDTEAQTDPSQYWSHSWQFPRPDVKQRAEDVRHVAVETQIIQVQDALVGGDEPMQLPMEEAAWKGQYMEGMHALVTEWRQRCQDADVEREKLHAHVQKLGMSLPVLHQT